MPKVALVNSEGQSLRTIGMPAPKRPAELQKWFRDAQKAHGLNIVAYQQVERCTEDIIIFALNDGCWLVIDRKANALGT